MLNYLAEAGESGLEQAYELGRKALDSGLGVVELAAVYHQALRSCLRSATTADDCLQRVKSLGGFFVESLSPFEMTHRGYRDAHAALRRLNEMMEDQAKRIAHELHDESGQLLVAVHIALQELALDLPAVFEGRIQKAKAGLDEIEEHLRRLSHELRPTILDDLGLVPALQFLAQGVSQRSGLIATVEGSTDGRLPPMAETTVYRIMQESLNNVVRHAKARRVIIRLRGGAKTPLWCSIQDDGVGFDVSSAKAKRGLGLIGIEERLKALGGSLEIRSSPGGGTELLAQIPPSH